MIYRNTIYTGSSDVADCAMLRVVEYFAKSRKVTQGHSKWYTIRKLWYGFLYSYFIATTCTAARLAMRYSESKNGVTLKSWFGVVQGHRKWRRSVYRHIRLSIGRPNNEITTGTASRPTVKVSVFI